jgi:hypothetical protein
MLILEIITGVLLPWVLLAPTMPLLLLLIRRDHFNKTFIALALLCVVSILANISILVASGTELQRSFLEVGFLTEIVFTALLLKYCTDHSLLRYGITSSVLIYASVYISFVGLSPGSSTSVINALGVSLIFLISILVLLSKSSRIDQNLLTMPEFWIAGGVFFRFGLLDLLLLTGKKIRDLDYAEPDDFSVLYVTVFVMQFLFFAGGILIRKPWANRE